MPKARRILCVEDTQRHALPGALPILWGEPDGRLGADVYAPDIPGCSETHDGRNRPGLANNSWNFFRFVT